MQLRIQQNILLWYFIGSQQRVHFFLWCQIKKMGGTTSRPETTWTDSGFPELGYEKPVLISRESEHGPIYEQRQLKHCCFDSGCFRINDGDYDEYLTFALNFKRQKSECLFRYSFSDEHVSSLKACLRDEFEIEGALSGNISEMIAYYLLDSCICLIRNGLFDFTHCLYQPMDVTDTSLIHVLLFANVTDSDSDSSSSGSSGSQSLPVWKATHPICEIWSKHCNFYNNNNFCTAFWYDKGDDCASGGCEQLVTLDKVDRVVCDVSIHLMPTSIDGYAEDSFYLVLRNQCIVIISATYQSDPTIYQRCVYLCIM